MGVGGEGEEIGNTVEADTGTKETRLNGECAQDGVATGAAAHDHYALGVG